MKKLIKGYPFKIAPLKKESFELLERFNHPTFFGKVKFADQFKPKFPTKPPRIKTFKKRLNILSVTHSVFLPHETTAIFFLNAAEILI